MDANIVMVNDPNACQNFCLHEDFIQVIDFFIGYKYDHAGMLAQWPMDNVVVRR